MYARLCSGPNVPFLVAGFKISDDSLRMSLNCWPDLRLLVFRRFLWRFL